MSQQTARPSELEQAGRGTDGQPGIDHHHEEVIARLPVIESHEEEVDRPRSQHEQGRPGAPLDQDERAAHEGEPSDPGAHQARCDAPGQGLGEVGRVVGDDPLGVVPQHIAERVKDHRERPRPVLVGAALLWRGKWNMLQTTTTPTTSSPEALEVEV